MSQRFVYWIVNHEKKKFKAGMFNRDSVRWDGFECSELNICYEHKDPDIKSNTDGYTMFIASDPETKEAANHQIGLLYHVFASLGYFPDNDIVIYRRSHKRGYEVCRRKQKMNSLYFGFQFPLSELNNLKYLSLYYAKDTSIVVTREEKQCPSDEE